MTTLIILSILYIAGLITAKMLLNFIFEPKSKSEVLAAWTVSALWPVFALYGIFKNIKR